MTALGYRIERSSAQTGPWTEVYDGAAAEYNDYDLDLGSEFWYRVQSYNLSGDSAWSTPVFGATALPIATTKTLPAQLRLGAVHSVPNAATALRDVQQYINQLVAATPVLREEEPGELGPVILVRKTDNVWTQMRIVPSAGISLTYDFAAHQLRMSLSQSITDIETLVASVSVTSPLFIGNLTGNVTGNADTVTNGVYTTGSYADPSWITSLAASKIVGAVAVTMPYTSLTYSGLTAGQVLRATGPASASFGALGLASVGAVTGVLPNAHTTATALNTASAIVARDGSGNFAAGAITASAAFPQLLLTDGATTLEMGQSGGVTSLSSGGTTFVFNKVVRGQQSGQFVGLNVAASAAFTLDMNITVAVTTGVATYALSGGTTPMHEFSNPLQVSAGSTTDALVVTTTGAIQGSFRNGATNRLTIAVGSGVGVTLNAVTSGATLFAFQRNSVEYFRLAASEIVIGASASVKLVTPLSGSARAGFAVLPGAAPSAPVDGDIWSVASESLYHRNNGVTQFASWTEQAAVADTTDVSDTATQLNDLLAKLRTINIIAT